MATDEEIGLDLSCVSDMDPRCSVVTGRRALVEAVLRRWTTPRGRLGYDPEYGFDVTDYINDDVDFRTIALIQSMMIAEAKKDERVLECELIITAPPGGIGIYKFEAVIYDADGPFTFTANSVDASALVLDESSFQEVA